MCHPGVEEAASTKVAHTDVEDRLYSTKAKVGTTSDRLYSTKVDQADVEALYVTKDVEVDQKDVAQSSSTKEDQLDVGVLCSTKVDAYSIRMILLAPKENRSSSTNLHPSVVEAEWSSKAEKVGVADDSSTRAVLGLAVAAESLWGNVTLVVASGNAGGVEAVDRALVDVPFLVFFVLILLTSDEINAL